MTERSKCEADGRMNVGENGGALETVTAGAGQDNDVDEEKN